MSDTADVSITIDPVNDAPVAPDDTATMNEDAGATAIDVLGNDSDVDGDDLTIVAKTDGVSGVVAITGGGSGLTYRPNDQFHGTDTLHLHGLRRATLADRDGHGHRHVGQRQARGRRRRLRRRRGRAGDRLGGPRRRHRRRWRHADDHGRHPGLEGRRRDHRAAARA